MTRNRSGVWLALLLCLAALPALSDGAVRTLNGDDPGAAVELPKQLVKGKTNIVYFYADW